MENELVDGVLNKLDIQKEIKKILKDSNFELDEATGYYYIKNRIDGKHLFEYSPKFMVLYISKDIRNYLLYRKFDEYKLNDNIRNSVEYIFDMFFKEHCMMENSMIEGMKEVRVRNILSNEIFDKYLKIPTNYFKINKLYLELITAETDYSISGFTRKFVFNNYDEINISSMRNGVYGLYIYKYNELFNKPLKFKINGD